MKRLLSGSLVLLAFCGFLGGCNNREVVQTGDRFATDLIESMVFVRNSRSGQCFGVVTGVLSEKGNYATTNVSIAEVSCEAVQHLLVNPAPPSTNPNK